MVFDTSFISIIIHDVKIIINGVEKVGISSIIMGGVKKSATVYVIKDGLKKMLD